MPQILLAVESAESRSLPLSAQRLLNYFVERQEADAKSQAPLFGAPGLTAFAVTGAGPVRGAWNFNGVAYEVSGTALYTIDAQGNALKVGDGVGGMGPVSMSDNGVQMGIVNGQSGWMYTVADGLTQIRSPNFYPANTITFVDGYFLFDKRGTNQWFISGLYDGLTYDGLDFATAEAQPGFVTAIVQNLQLEFIICTGHIELWYNAGSANFPFQRYAGGVINYGSEAPHSVLKQDGAIFLLGTDKVFYRLQGNVPIRISTHYIEHVLALDPDLTTVEGITYTLEGHKMLAWTLPSSNRTLEFDISTSKWHERESHDENGYALGRWRARTALNCYGKTLIGDAFDGRVGLLDWSTYTEYGNQICGLIHSAPQHSDRKRLFVSRFELDIQAGVGTTTGQGSDPQMMLQWSKDGGQTWSDLQPWRSVGKIGEFLRRLRWLRMGNARQWVWRITVSDPVQRVIIAAHADIAVGM